MADQENPGPLTSDTDATDPGLKSQGKRTSIMTRSATAAATCQLGDQSGEYFTGLTMDGESDFYYDREFPAVEKSRKRHVTSPTLGKFFAKPALNSEPMVAPAAKISKSRRGRGGITHNAGVSAARYEMNNTETDSDSSTLTETPKKNKRGEKVRDDSSALTTEDLCQKAEKTAEKTH
jgi:hypothetical protein